MQRWILQQFSHPVPFWVCLNNWLKYKLIEAFIPVILPNGYKTKRRKHYLGGLECGTHRSEMVFSSFQE